MGLFRPRFSRAQITRSYAVVSGENSSLATDPRALIATQERTPGTWRLLCGICAHMWFTSPARVTLALDVVSYPPRIYKREYDRY